MSLTRLKNGILKRAMLPDNGGTVDPMNSGFSNGDRYGRIARKASEKNCRILEAIAELEAEGRVKPLPGYNNLWFVPGSQVDPTRS